MTNASQRVKRNSDNEKLAIRAWNLRYVHLKKQTEVAKELGLGEGAVRRASDLEKCAVEWQLIGELAAKTDPDYLKNLSEKLVKCYPDLNGAEVVDGRMTREGSDENRAILYKTTKRCAQSIWERCHSGISIGIPWGERSYLTTSQLAPLNRGTQNISLYPMVGAIDHTPHPFDANTLCKKAALQLGVEAKPYHLMAHAIEDEANFNSVVAANKKVFAALETAKIIVAPINDFNYQRCTAMERNLIPKAHLKNLNGKAVGELGTFFYFDAYGDELQPNRKRAVGLNLNRLKEMYDDSTIIGVACSSEKRVLPMYIAIKYGRLINHLVTDASMAERLLDLEHLEQERKNFLNQEGTPLLSVVDS